VDPGGTLARRGIRLEMKVAETYGEEQTSILRTAALWAQNVSAFIGPQESCLHEARMAAAFNLPMISYVSCQFFKTSARKKTFFTTVHLSWWYSAEIVLFYFILHSALLFVIICFCD
jgi:Receptor family ligand binding region